MIIPVLNYTGIGKVWWHEDELSHTVPTGFKHFGQYSKFDDCDITPADYAAAVTWTGNGTSQSIECGFSPDLIITARYNATATAGTWWHAPLLGTEQILTTVDDRAVASESGGVTSFDTTGFTIGSSSVVNANGLGFNGYALKASAASGIAVFEYTGDGTTPRAIAHGLGKTPSLIFVKQTDAVRDWKVWHEHFARGQHMELDSASAVLGTNITIWSDTDVTPHDATNFYVGTSLETNQSGGNYLAMVFAEIEGFSRIDTYEGNGDSVDGFFVECGFRPEFVLIKCMDSAYNWQLFSSERHPYNPISTADVVNGSAATGTGHTVYFTSSGFFLRDGQNTVNRAGNTYIFAAFAAHPMKIARAF